MVRSLGSSTPWRPSASIAFTTARALSSLKSWHPSAAVAPFLEGPAPEHLTGNPTCNATERASNQHRNGSARAGERQRGHQDDGEASSRPARNRTGGLLRDKFVALHAKVPPQVISARPH